MLRTGGAALRTVTVLVDEILRPALEDAGLPPAAVGLARSADREGARILVSLPSVLPLVILRGSGETTAALAREAAAHGVRTLAHAEGGGVLYIGAAADPAKAEALVEASLDRLGVCNRLNLLLVDRAARRRASRRCSSGSASPCASPSASATSGRTTPTTSRRSRCASSSRSTRRSRSRTARPRASPRRSSPRTRPRRSGSSTLYRGTAAFWNATTRFTDGFALTGSPETGINVDRVPGPRGPVTYRDLYLRQYRVVGDGTQHR